MSHRLRLCSGAEAVKKFKRLGWTVDRQVGSHVMLVKRLQKRLFMGKRLLNNFSRRFGDPARIQIKFAQAQLSPSEMTYQSKKMATAYVDILRNLLGRESTDKEILGKVDISMGKRGKNNRDNNCANCRDGGPV